MFIVGQELRHPRGRYLFQNVCYSHYLMSALASTRYYLYRSPWFMLFIVSSLILVFILAALFELGSEIPPQAFKYVLLFVIIGLGVGAAGMGLEVASELEE